MYKIIYQKYPKNIPEINRRKRNVNKDQQLKFLDTENKLIKYNNEQTLKQNQDNVKPSIMQRSCFMKFNLSSLRGLVKIFAS